MEKDFIIVFCTFPDLKIARQTVNSLVEQRLIACGNLLPGIESIYRWKDKVEHSSEVMAVLKTTRDKFDPLKSAFAYMHPYEVPELISATISDGLPAYLAWISQNTGGGLA